MFTAGYVDGEEAHRAGLVVETNDTDAGARCHIPGHPLRFSDFDPEVNSPVPRLGAHTDAVFSGVADDQTTLDEWRDGDAFGD